MRMHKSDGNVLALPKYEHTALQTSDPSLPGADGDTSSPQWGVSLSDGAVDKSAKCESSETNASTAYSLGEDISAI